MKHKSERTHHWQDGSHAKLLVGRQRQHAVLARALLRRKVQHAHPAMPPKIESIETEAERSRDDAPCDGGWHWPDQEHVELDEIHKHCESHNTKR